LFAITVNGTPQQSCDLNSAKGRQRKKAAGADSSDLRPIWLPTLDNLRNFLLTANAEMLSFFQQLREAP
jgi:hypothetical protein